MAYNSLITRSNVEALIPEDVTRQIIQSVPEQSAVMRLGRRLPNMTSKQRRMPVLAGLISAYFVSGDTGLKKTTQAQWGNKFINAEELAVIVPIPEAVLDDADYDIWGEIQPRIVEAFGKTFDAAVLYGTNAPQDWPLGLVPLATAASNVVTVGAGNDIYDDIMGEAGVIAKVELDGYMVNGHVAALQMRSKLRGLREKVYDGTNLLGVGQPLFVRTMQERSGYELDGVPMEFPRNGAIDATEALMISGDWNQLVYSIRQDITYKILDQAVIQDEAGNIIQNLAQQDMVALRAVMRLGWQLPNPLNQINSNNTTRFPFAALLP